MCKNILASALLLISTVSISAFPADTIALWNGTKVSHGKDVVLYAFRPVKPNGISVIVCPGGSYYWLDENCEGLDVGEWLSSNGITAYVLFYRTAGAAEFVWHSRIIFRGKRHPDMITDVQRAKQFIWENSQDYGIDREKTGILGFSAGGHLAMSAACFSSTDFLENEGITTDADLRPAFVALVYPVVTMHSPYVHKRSRRGLLGDSRAHNKALIDSLSLENHIPTDCPPVFLTNCTDDPVVNYRNSELLDSALSVHDVPHRYIRYERGKHGFGVSDHYGSPECREWKNEFLGWLKGLYSPSL